MLQPTIPAPPVLDPLRPKPVPAAAAAKASLLAVEFVTLVVAVVGLSVSLTTSFGSAARVVSGNAAEAASAAAPPAAAAKSALRERGAEALSVMFSLSWIACDGAAVAASSIVACPRAACVSKRRWYRWAIAVREHAQYRDRTSCHPRWASCHGGRALAMADAHTSAGDEPPLAPGTQGPTRADALRRIAAEVSGRHDLDGLFRDVIDEAFTLFGVDQAGLWLFEDGPTPLHIVAQRGLSQEILDIVSTLPRDAQTAGMDALRDQQVQVLSGDLGATVPRLRTIYRRAGVRTICFVPIVFRGTSLGLLVLYHLREYAWTPEETEVARAFADHMATAIGNARLAESTRTMADRLRAISELASRLNRLQDVEGIAQAIVSGTRTLIEHDTIRVYRVDHETAMCEPIGFQGEFMGATNPDPSVLRVAIGKGLTGWVAAHGEPVRLGDAMADPRDARRPVDGWAGVDAPRPDAVRRHRPRGHRDLEGRPRPVRRGRRDDPDDLRRLCRPGPGQRHQHGATALAAG